MDALGSMFKDTAQLLYNTGVAEGTLKNVFYDRLNSDSASTNFNFFYNAGTDLYEMIDLSGITEYIIIEATSLSAPWTSNNTRTIQISSGKWLVYCTTGTDEVKRAQIHKSLWYGTTGSDALIEDFTSVTTVQTSHADDVGKRAFKLFATETSGAGASYTIDGVPANTSDNVISSWSKLFVDVIQGGNTNGTA